VQIGLAQHDAARLASAIFGAAYLAILSRVARQLIGDSAALAAPLLAILVQALKDSEGNWAGLANFWAYVQTPTLLNSLWNSVWVSALVTVIVLPMAFVFAYALVRSCMPLAAIAPQR
jgi:iron(III) transport system permease protein